MLAGLERINRDRGVCAVGNADGDRVNAGIGQQQLVGGVRLGDLMASGLLFQAIRQDVTEGDDFRVSDFRKRVGMD